MPIEFDIWRIDGSVSKIVPSRLADESRLETILTDGIGLLGLDVMVIGRQVVTAFGKRIDLLAIDAQGDLHVIEIKRDRTPREVVAQLLDYGSWVKTLGYTEVTSIFSAHQPETPFEEAFVDRFGGTPPESINDAHRLVIVASELDASTERIVSYLSEQYSVPINAVFFRYFRDQTREYLARTWLIERVQEDVRTSIVSSVKQGKEAWNGRDFYVSLGEGPSRSWDDCRKYGFISAGGGRWYSRTLDLLFPGARVFVCIPGGTGYVGVGIVRDRVQRVDNFATEVDGELRPILTVPLVAKQMGQNASDSELAEYLVRVEWIREMNREEAVWDKGMFANQNSVCKLTNKFTLERLIERFDLRNDAVGDNFSLVGMGVRRDS